MMADQGGAQNPNPVQPRPGGPRVVFAATGETIFGAVDEGPDNGWMAWLQYAWEMKSEPWHWHWHWPCP